MSYLWDSQQAGEGTVVWSRQLYLGDSGITSMPTIRAIKKLCVVSTNLHRL